MISSLIGEQNLLKVKLGTKELEEESEFKYLAYFVLMDEVMETKLKHRLDEVVKAMRGLGGL